MQVFRILIVDDIPYTLEQLRKLFAEVLPDVHVDTASTVEQARERIESPMELGLRYDVVILDFKLPKSQGMHDEVDESICLGIPRPANTLVIHMTAYKEDPAIVQHMATYHTKRDEPEAELISKRDLDWDQKLLARIKAHLYGGQIERQFDQVFGDSMSSSQSARGHNGQTYACGSFTHQLAALKHNIAEHWHDLDKRLQRKIQTVFTVETNGQKIDINLL